MKRILILLFLCTFIVSGLCAARLGGVTMPNHRKVQGKRLVLNGLGMREATIFSVDVYVAGLYLQRKSRNARGILASRGIKHLEMKFVRNVSKSDLTGAWTDGFKKNAGGRYGSFVARIRRLNSMMKKMSVGERMAFTFTSGGVHVYVNSRKKGFVRGGQFSRIMLAIWLGSSPPNSGLKRGMLGR